MRDLSGARAPSQPRLFYDYKFKLSVLNRLGGVGRPFKLTNEYIGFLIVIALFVLYALQAA
jgi:hypothetical protein